MRRYRAGVANVARLRRYSGQPKSRCEVRIAAQSGRAWYSARSLSKGANGQLYFEIRTDLSRQRRARLGSGQSPDDGQMSS
jgi:hypothetical protein